MSSGALVYALVTGVLVAIGSWAVDGLGRTHQRPTRWAWALGLAAMVLLGATSLARGRGHDSGTRMVELGSLTATSTTITATPGRVARLALAVLQTTRDLMTTTLASVARVLPPRLGGGAAALWVLATALALMALALVHLRIARVRRAWPVAELHGHRVRIAPSVGPAVLGLVQPFIVVPRWLLARPESEQRMVLEHEAEHVRAGDHLLLSAGWIAVALMPWHPAAWWALSRLRLAIELDCDARVLKRGVAVRAYGTLLIDLAGQCTGFTAGATALADESSHLQRRLLAMKPITSRYTSLRAGALCAIGAVAILAACEAKIPTSAEVQTMDVAGAERATMSMHNVKFSMENAEFFVDGKPTTAAEAHAIPNTRIASINVEASNGTRPARVMITTGESAPSGFPMTVHMRHVAGAGDSVSLQKLHAEHTAEMSRNFAGLVMIDGVKSDNAALGRLKPNDLVTVDILKGAMATSLYSDPAAANGVIRVTTAAGAAKK